MKEAKMAINKKRDKMGFAFFILAFLFFLTLSVFALGLAQADNQNGAYFGLWINKTADQSSYGQEDNMTFIINYGNNGGKKVTDVSIVDILPDVEIIYASPFANSSVGNNLTWYIPDLMPGQSGSITLMVKLPDKPYVNFNEESLVLGDGFVNIRKSISTIRENNSLTNTAIIYGTIGEGTIDKKGLNSSTSVAVKLIIKPKEKIKSSEHGSGHYREVQNSSLNTSMPSMKLKKEISATYMPVALRLSGDKVLKLRSLWSDRTSALTEENGTVNYVASNYFYMNAMSKETSYNLNWNEIAYQSQGNFSGGIANFEYFNKASDNKRSSAFISETYHGTFETQERLDTYGSSPTYFKSASGIGFVSSDKVAGCDLRSYERGSGSYESTESIQAGTILKNSILVYMPNKQLAGISPVSYTNKWSEAMYARDAEMGSEILNRISYADYVQKEALMSPTFLSATGKFEGMNYLKAKKLNTTDNSNPIMVEQVLTGQYHMDTTVNFGENIKYTYPHINLTKRVLSRDGNTFIYRIWVNNDGGKTLGSVAVVDLLPRGATFVSSTLKPSVQGRIVSWTLQSLPSGTTTIIDLKVYLADVSSRIINSVQAAARYENHTIIAKASASPYNTIEEQEEITNKTIEEEEASTTGEWKPPACYDLISGPISCEKEIDAYYDNLSQEWLDTGCA
jgi:uncharacterized repeat protein (TIGR01451 family)